MGKLKRTLTVTIAPDRSDFLRASAKRAAVGVKGRAYQGEVLAFDSPATFFSKLTERRWQLVNELLGNGTVGMRELARRVGRDVRRVHDDTSILVELGLMEKDARGALHCPYDEIHIDMHMTARKVA